MLGNHGEPVMLEHTYTVESADTAAVGSITLAAIVSITAFPATAQGSAKITNLRHGFAAIR